jgi:hypothetical protein
MAEYQINWQATTNTAAGTFDQFIELKAAANTTIVLKRVRASFPGSAAGAPNDYVAQIKVLRNTAAGAGGSAVPAAGTQVDITKLRTNAPTSTVTAVVKNTTSSFTTGTNYDVPIWDAVNTRSVFEWIAADQEEWIETNATGNYIAIAIACSAASQVFNTTVTWEE